jgi:CrcB protein
VSSQDNDGPDMIWLYVALGSAIGGVARFALATLVQQNASANFPVGTLVVNISGSFLLGLLFRYSLGASAITLEMRVLLTAGFCGGYTTFSTFSYDTILLLEEGRSGRAGAYVPSSVVLSLAATWLGIMAARALLAVRSQS